MNGYEAAQREYDNRTPFDDDYDGYCPECDMDSDEHAEDCANAGTTEAERAREAHEAYEDAKGEAEYEARKEREYDEEPLMLGDW